MRGFLVGPAGEMRIHHLRSATFVLEAAERRVLVDPMLGAKGTVLPPLAFIRHKPRRNPTVDLPPQAEEMLIDLDAALVTHCRRRHDDHLDRQAHGLLRRRDLPVYCHALDVGFLRQHGLRAEPMTPHNPRDFFGGTITAFHAVHGYGLLAKLMGPGAGYLIELPDEPSLYLSGDTVLTAEVRSVLTDQRPDVAVMHAGSASTDVGRPILMPIDELLEFVRLAPGRVVANHLEALNHCPTTRAQLSAELEKAGLRDRVLIPADGETVEL
jgi:L-ascorbate metabolism protein UlaG (beta-lactamase superfamily)